MNGAVPKSADEFLEELRELNIDGIGTDWLAQRLREVHECLVTKGISEWTREAIKKYSEEWRQKRYDPEAALVDLIAVACRACVLTQDYHPRDSQILSILLLFSRSIGASANSLQRRGCLLQIATGEGKSITVAMFAAVKALRDNEKVDVVTCSDVLACRDAQDLAEFYGMFGLSVAYCTDKSLSKTKRYGADILYGDISSFKGDILRHEFKAHKKIRGDPERPFASVIIDEADSMLLDEVIEGYLLKLSFSIPGMEYLESLLCLLWLSYTIHKPTPHPTNSRKVCLTIDGQQYDCYASEFEDRLKKEFEGIISAGTKRLDDGTTIDIHIPRNLHKFARQRLPRWIQSMKSAISGINEGRDYCVHEGKVVPIDFQNTGVWHGGSFGRWCITYRELYGLSGTLGNRREQTFLRDSYNTEIVLIPTFAASQLQQLPPIYADNVDNWIDQIGDNVFDVVVRQERAVLIICESIDDLTRISGSIGSMQTLKVYKNIKGSDVFPSPVKPLDLIYTTNIGGRGTDYEASQELEQNGGMHVIVTFMPKNERVQRQAFGRTARKGQKGTAQLIVHSNRTIADRDRSADQQMTYGEKRLPLISLKEELFTKFSQFYGKIREKSGEDERLLSQLEEHWGFWLYEKFNLGYSFVRRPIFVSDGVQINIVDTLHIELEQFIRDLENKINANDLSIYENPSFLVLKAYDLLHEDKNLTAKKHLKKAIELAGGDTSAFATPALYYMPLALIGKGHEQLRNGKSVDECREYQDKAVVYYRKAIDCAQKLKEWVSLQLLVKQMDQEEIDQLKQVNNKIQLINQLQAKCQECITHIDNCSADSICKFSQWEENPDQDNEMPELDELREFGVHAFYQLGYEKPSSMCSIVSMFVLGAFQIAIGVVCICSKQPKAAAIFIQNGISDIVTALKAQFFNTPIDWKRWGVEKIVSYGLFFLKWAGTKIRDGLNLRKATDLLGLTTKKAASMPENDGIIEIFFNAAKKEVLQFVASYNVQIDFPDFQLCKELISSKLNAAPMPFKMNCVRAIIFIGAKFFKKTCDRKIHEWVNGKFKQAKDFKSLLGKRATETLLSECIGNLIGIIPNVTDELMENWLLNEMTTKNSKGEEIRLSKSQVKQVKELLNKNDQLDEEKLENKKDKLENCTESEALQKLKNELGWDDKFDPILSQIAKRTVVGMTSQVEKNMDQWAENVAETLHGALSQRIDWLRENPTEEEQEKAAKKIRGWQRAAKDPFFVPFIMRGMFLLIMEGESSVTPSSDQLPNIGVVFGCISAIDDNLQRELAPVLKHLYQVDYVDKMTIEQVLNFQAEFMGPNEFNERSGQVQNTLNMMVESGVITATLLNRLWHPRSGFGSSAVGAFKFGHERLQLLAKRHLGKKWKKILFEQKIQEFLAYKLMRGLDNFLKNSLNDESKRKFGVELCKVWPSLGVPPGTTRTNGELLTENSSYFTNNVMAKITWERMERALSAIHEELSEAEPVLSKDETDESYVMIKVDVDDSDLKCFVNDFSQIAIAGASGLISKGKSQIASQCLRCGVFEVVFKGLNAKFATHEVLLVTYKCDVCSLEVPTTYEIKAKNKSWSRRGRYTKVEREERITGIGFSAFCDIERIFNDMPTSDDSSKRWTTEMIKRLQKKGLNK